MPVIVVKRARLKNIYLTVSQNSIEIKAPYSTAQREIEQLLNKHKTFVSKQYRRLVNRELLEEQDKMLFLGETLPFRIIVDKEKKESFKIVDNEIIFTLHEQLTKEKKEALRVQLYKHYAPKYIASEVASLEQKMNLAASRVSFRKTKSQWGSCSHNNAISLNSYLLLLPKELREYIIIHELSHIIHKNHSKEFWTFVSRYYPKYKDARDRLKEYAYFLRL